MVKNGKKVEHSKNWLKMAKSGELLKIAENGKKVAHS